MSRVESGVEDRDLDVRISFGFIASGKLRDILKLKESLISLLNNELHDTKLVYITISSDKLWIKKRRKEE